MGIEKFLFNTFYHKVLKEKHESFSCERLRDLENRIFFRTYETTRLSFDYDPVFKRLIVNLNIFILHDEEDIALISRDLRFIMNETIREVLPEFLETPPMNYFIINTVYTED